MGRKTGAPRARSWGCSDEARNFPTIPSIATPTEIRADLPPEPASAGKARQLVDATLRTWSCEQVVDVAVLLVSELVANSVLHAHTDISLVIRLNGEVLRIEVYDRERRAPTRKHYSSMATTGRGLMLVEQLAQDWGVTSERDGKSVWFELDSTGAPPGDPARFAFSLDMEDEFERGSAGASTPSHVTRPSGEGRRPSALRLLVGARP